MRMELFKEYMRGIGGDSESISITTETLLKRYIQLAEKLHDNGILQLTDKEQFFLLKHLFFSSVHNSESLKKHYGTFLQIIHLFGAVWGDFTLWPGLSRLNHRDIKKLGWYGYLVDPCFNVNARIDNDSTLLHCFARCGSVHYLKLIFNRERSSCRSERTINWHDSPDDGCKVWRLQHGQIFTR